MFKDAKSVAIYTLAVIIFMVVLLAVVGLFKIIVLGVAGLFIYTVGYMRGRAKRRDEESETEQT